MSPAIAMASFETGRLEPVLAPTSFDCLAAHSLSLPLTSPPYGSVRPGADLAW